MKCFLIVGVYCHPHVLSKNISKNLILGMLMDIAPRSSPFAPRSSLLAPCPLPLAPCPLLLVPCSLLLAYRLPQLLLNILHRPLKLRIRIEHIIHCTHTIDHRTVITPSKTIANRF